MFDTVYKDPLFLLRTFFFDNNVIYVQLAACANKPDMLHYLMTNEMFSSNCSHLICFLSLL